MYSSIEVPPHLIKNDDGTLPDNIDDAREKAIEEEIEKWKEKGLDSDDLERKEKELDKEIEKTEYALRRLKNAVKFYVLAWRTAKGRAKRHGEEGLIGETLSGNQSVDGWTIKRATEWPESGGGSSGGGKLCAVHWEPSDATLEKEGIQPDDLDPRLDLRYNIEDNKEVTWQDVLNDLVKHLEVEKQDVERISRDLSEAEFSRSVIKEKWVEIVPRKGEPDGGEEDEPDLPYHPATNEYLRIAIRWLESGKRPEGDRPTPIFQHIRTETENSIDTIRQTFQRHDWHAPHPPPEQTQAEYTVEAILSERDEHF